MSVASMVLVCWCGCSQQSELQFRTRDEVTKLPAKHQQQIAGFLTKYFGTPLSPRLMKPAPPSDASGAAPPPAEGADLPLVDAVSRGQLRHGAQVYTQLCAGCHGTTGDGLGPAGSYLDPPPRDYRLGRFKFGSTPRGLKPRREDLVRIIHYGAKGTSMPPFRWMAEDDLEAVIDYVMLLSQRGELELSLAREAESELTEEDDLAAVTVAEYATRIAASWQDAASQVVLPLTPRPPVTDETIAAGAKAFVELNCFKCHGPDGRGNKAFNVGKDDWGRTAFAADLTSGMLHGGRRSVDIYRRIYSGINGTPMPAFNTPDSSKNETPEQRSETIWHMVHFVTTIVDGKPLPTELIDATIRAMNEATKAASAPQPPSEPVPPSEPAPPADAKPEEKKPEEAKPEDKKADAAKPEDKKPEDKKPADEKQPADEKKTASESQP